MNGIADPSTAVGNGNGTKVTLHRDSIVGGIIFSGIFSIASIAVLTSFHAPLEWSLVNKATDALITMTASAITAYFARLRPQS